MASIRDVYPVGTPFFDTNKEAVLRVRDLRPNESEDFLHFDDTPLCGGESFDDLIQSGIYPGERKFRVQGTDRLYQTKEEAVFFAGSDLVVEEVIVPPVFVTGRRFKQVTTTAIVEVK